MNNTNATTNASTKAGSVDTVSTNRKRVLLQTTSKAGGDLNPMVALARGLKTTGGYDLVVLCDPPTVPVFDELNIRTVVSGPEYEVGPTVKEALAASKGLLAERRADVVKAAVEVWGRHLVPSASRLLEQEQPDAIVTSMFGTCVGASLHRIWGVPWVAVNSTFYIGPNPPRTLERDFSERASDVFRYSIVPYLGDAALVLHATDPVFDYDHRGLPAHHRYTGPLAWEQPGYVPGYVTSPGDPWMLCTLSSLKQDDIPIARAAMDALENTGHRIVVTLGPGHSVEEGEPVPTNAHVAQYIPHSAILERGQLLISHAGHGSVMKALTYGVPMVLVPWSRDQFGVAARAQSMGAARVIPRESLTTETMADAIRQVSSDPSYAISAKRAAQRLKEQDPVPTAVQMIEEFCFEA